ncbi:MAG TPA: MSMEG_0565 family glycosyltransferase [Streptosporangiaceae bacterium]|nr:MSMEG_0565 family glycosyltransferase [Streptosporangiaceae bacterium]
MSQPVPGQVRAVPVALVTYSVKPRGGVVHTLALAEALHAIGYPVRVFALGDPASGFYRPVRAPFTIIPAPPLLPTLEERVFASVAALAAALEDLVTAYPVMHAQDCISARALCRIRDEARSGHPGTSGHGPHGHRPFVIRTVHHVDDFTSPSLIDCQQRAIIEPDKVLVVSEYWRRLLREQYGVEADVVHNGVDAARYRPADSALAARLRARAGAADRPLILAVGGIEPRKGSDTLMRALAALRDSGCDAVLAIIGGHSFQDYRAYAERVLAMLPGLGLRLGTDVVQLGTVPDDELPGWYAAADVLAFPSTKEGWGLAILEAMSAGLPVVVSDLPVFLEYLRPGRDALMVPVGDAAALSKALADVLGNPSLAGDLRAAGLATSGRFTWSRSAREHQASYASAG